MKIEKVEVTKPVEPMYEYRITLNEKEVKFLRTLLGNMSSSDYAHFAKEADFETFMDGRTDTVGYFLFCMLNKATKK